MQRALTRSFVAMLGLFLVDAGVPLASWPQAVVRVLLALSVSAVVCIVVMMSCRRQPIALPVQPAAVMRRLKALKEKLKQKKSDTRFRERVSYQHERMVKKLAKAHDVPVHTTQHLKVQQNLGFLKR